MKRIFTVAIVIVSLAGAAFWYLGREKITMPSPEFVTIGGGTFEAGNFRVTLKEGDRAGETVWAKEPQFSQPAHTVTLNSYSLMASEPTNADFDAFLHDTGRPERAKDDSHPAFAPDRPALMAFHEAQAYCAWLGELIGRPLRLPTEAEWEYAARNRGEPRLYGTDTGELRWGENVTPKGSGRIEAMVPVNSFPANPLGLYDMAEGAYEWVGDRGKSDPENVRITKGGSRISDIEFETIPSRSVVEPADASFLETFEDLDRLKWKHSGPIYLNHATARCAGAPATAE